MSAAPRRPVPPSRDPARGSALLHVFAWTRFLIVGGVAAALLLSAALLATCALTAVRIAWDVASARDFTDKATKSLSIQVIELVDGILLATVVYIVALGLYELFVDPELPVPAWLHVESLDDLKAKLVGVVVVLLGVTFLRYATAWDGSHGILYVGGGIALVVGALALSGSEFVRRG